MLLIINADTHLLHFLIENWIIILINYDYDCDKSERSANESIKLIKGAFELSF